MLLFYRNLKTVQRMKEGGKMGKWVGRLGIGAFLSALAAMLVDSINLGVYAVVLAILALTAAVLSLKEEDKKENKDVSE